MVAARAPQVFRSHKSGLRMHILTGSAAQRRRILRAAFLVRPCFCRTAHATAVMTHKGTQGSGLTLWPVPHCLVSSTKMRCAVKAL